MGDVPVDCDEGDVSENEGESDGVVGREVGEV